MSKYQEDVQRLAARRAASMQKLRDKGMTYAEIAQRHGLTRQRVHQILTTYREAS